MNANTSSDESHNNDRPAMLGERKLVTVLFADISGFTAMSEKMDPEAIRDLINACFARLVPLIKKHYGVIEKFIGDEIMAVFGAPVIHENDPELAVLSAMEMMQALETFNREWATDLGMHIGINTGPVIAGGIGSPDEFQYGVLGDTVNLASRLADASERGQVFVGAHTYRLIETLFEFDPLPPMQVKGKSEPVAVYLLKGSKEKPGQRRGLAGYGLQSPMVGRNSELNRLQECIRRVRAGQGGIVGVIGEAGLGKTRLVSEAISDVGRDTPSIQGSAPVILEGATLSYGQTIGFWPFQEIVRLYLEIAEEDTVPVAWGKLESHLQALFPSEMDEVLPYLASLLAFDAPGEWGERQRYLDADALGRQIFRAMRRFFERLAQGSPLILIFEDLHWMDEVSTRLLEYLLSLVEISPILIVGLSRPYLDTPAARLQGTVVEKYKDYYTEVRLAPLPPLESAQLLRNLLQSIELPFRLRSGLIEKSDGNPYFLEEVIRSLIETGAVVHDPANGRWKVSEDVGKITIPDTIQGVLMSRIDRLDEEVKRVLRLASVVGRSFFYSILRAVEQNAQQLDHALDELQQVELVLVKQRLPELEYIFKHALAQEATYESILIQQRRQLHLRIGQIIEELFTDRLEEFYGLLAYHYARAEAWEKAQEYLLKAGDEAGRLAADTEALAYYRQATDAYVRLFGESWDPLQQASLVRKIGGALWRRGEHLQALEHLEQGLSYLGRSLPKNKLSIRLGIVKEVARQLGHRLLPRLFLPALSIEPAPTAVEEVLLYEAITWIEGFNNIERFVLGSLCELNTAEESSFHLGTVLASIGIGFSLANIPVYWAAAIYFRQAEKLAERIQNPVATGLTYYGLCAHELNQGNLPKAAFHGERSFSVYQQVGDLHGYFLSLSIYAYVLSFQGKISTSLALSESIVKESKEVSDRMSLGQGYLMQGIALRLLGGNYALAISSLQDAIQISGSVPDHYSIIVDWSELGRCYGKTGAISQALEAFDKSKKLTRQYQMTMPYTQCSYYNGLAETYLLAAEQEKSSRRVSLLKKAGQACRGALKHGKVSPVGMPEAMRLQGWYEWLDGKPAHARQWWLRSLSKAESLGMPYDIAMAKLMIGHRFNDQELLDSAQAELDRLGVTPRTVEAP